MQLIDAHVHVGRFKGHWFEPAGVGRFLLRQGVEGCVASATVAAVGRHEDAVRDLDQLLSIPGLAVWPLLWVTPGLLSRHPDLAKPLARLAYRGLKIHPRANRWSNVDLDRAFRIAGERDMAILVHTDDDPDSQPSRLRPIIMRHPGVRVVLAHGRPIEQAMEVLLACSNASVDTAFMPTPHVKRLLQAGHASRILFGSDTPIDRLFYTGPAANRYRMLVRSIQRCSGPMAETHVLRNNALCIYGSPER